MRELFFSGRKDSVVLRDVGMCGRGIVRNTIYVFVVRREGLASYLADSRGKGSRKKEGLPLWGRGQVFE